MKTQTYNQPYEQVFNRILNNVRRRGYKIDSLDKVNGLITFKTGASWRSFNGQQMSALIIPIGENCSVDIGGQRNGKFQRYDWGEADAIASQLL